MIHVCGTSPPDWRSSTMDVVGGLLFNKHGELGYTSSDSLPHF